MNRLFANHVTSAAFNLSLSQKMIDALMWLESSKSEPKYGYIMNSLSTANALLHRGLIIRKPDYPAWGPDNARDVFQLTEAGEHVCALLRIAGYAMTESGELLKMDIELEKGEKG